MGFGRVASDLSGTNAWLIQEGRKDFAVAPPIVSRTNILNAADLPAGRFTSYRAFSSVALNSEEQNILALVSAAFQKEAQPLAAALKQVAATEKVREEFESYLSMATDNNPSIQCLVAKCYLEGRGTPKDEQRGLEWMRKAAANGSGEAQDYLENLARKTK
jgi:TPR repeat protein